MRKKLETLPLSELKAIAKENNLKNISTLRKAELIDRLCALHEERQASQNVAGAEPEESKEEKRGGEPSTELTGETEKECGFDTEKTEEKRDNIDSAYVIAQPKSSPEEAEKVYQEGAPYIAVPAQPAEGENRRPREYRPRNSEFAQRASGNNMRRSQSQQMRQGMNRPQRNFSYNQGIDRRNYNRPQYTRNEDGETVQPDQTVKAVAETEMTHPMEAVSRPEGAEQRGETVAIVPESVVQVSAEGTLGAAGVASVAEISSAKASADGSTDNDCREDLQALDSGIVAQGILEVMPDGFGFIRSANYLPGDEDVYVAPSQIRRFNLKTGDIITGMRRIKTSAEKFAALLYLTQVNGYSPSVLETRPNFEDLTPIFPNYRLHLERPGGTKAMRIVDLLSPIGKGQRGMIVSQPKAGKTTLLKDVAKAITINHPDMHLIVLLIDERPEEVTDIKESIEGDNVEVIYSTFDELPDHHKRVSEMVLERAKRLVEHGRDVMILLDSITRLARAYNLTVAPSGRTLSGGLDPAALYMPKRFFGAARNMREGGSLTILATALVDTGSRMDDVVFEEFKGTGNMELVLNRKLSEKRIFPAIDIMKSGTRRDDLLLTPEERAAADLVHKITNESKGEEAAERVLNLFSQTKTNREFIAMAGKLRPGI